jgi:hypothetical protein
MAWTSTTLKAAIEDYIQSTEASFVSNLDNIIAQAEDRISKAVILPSARKAADITLTNGSVVATLPSDFLAPFSLLINSAGLFTAAAYADVSLIRELYPNPLMTGVPRWYSMMTSSTIVLSPTPTSGLSATLNYFYKPASIVTGGTSWLGTNAENCLLYGCLSEAYTYIKGEADLMKLYEDKFVMALKDLKTLGEGLDLGDSFRFGERRVPR